MTPELKAQLIAAHKALPPDLRHRPVSETALKRFEARFGPIPADFRWYLSECGGGIVGSERVSGITDLRESHVKFRAESGDSSGWTMKNVFIIGWDGSGNPFGIDLDSGSILVEDHDFGGIHEMAPSFEAFLTRGLRPDEPRKRRRSPPWTKQRLHLPENCETVGQTHSWFNIDDRSSGCYNCRTRVRGRLWGK